MTPGWTTATWFAASISSIASIRSNEMTSPSGVGVQPPDRPVAPPRAVTPDVLLVARTEHAATSAVVAGTDDRRAATHRIDCQALVVGVVLADGVSPTLTFCSPTIPITTSMMSLICLISLAVHARAGARGLGSSVGAGSERTVPARARASYVPERSSSIFRALLPSLRPGPFRPGRRASGVLQRRHDAPRVSGRAPWSSRGAGWPGPTASARAPLSGGRSASSRSGTTSIVGARSP